MKLRTIISLLLLMLASTGIAQKTVYIPQQTLKDEGYDPSTKVNNLNVPWCRYRSRESDNIIVFWAAGYGNNDPNSEAVPWEYRVDIDDLLAKLETFYDLNVNRLKFADLSNSNLSKYKMVICLYYTTEWMAYGGGFDDLIGGMWISPSTCKPVGETIAHEIGHSFQYQCFCDLHGAAGFRYNFGPNGCSYWEATAEWQAVMAYPDLMYSMSMYIYRKSHNMAMTHEWMRYQSYWMHFWWCDRHGLDMEGRLWRGSTQWGDDVNQVYMKLLGLSVRDLYKEYMNAAMHFVTWDFNNADWKARGSYFDIGNFVYNYVPVGNNEYQVAYYSCPQSTGYNVIPLEVPKAGTTISTHFTALPPGAPLADGDPRMFWNGAFDAPIGVDNYNHFNGEGLRGFRLGYVALKRDGTRVYQSEDKVYCTGTAESSVDVSFTVPENVDRLWLVVSPALSQYIMHEWDENMTNDDQWPYRVKFTGTSIPGSKKYYLYDESSDRFMSRGGTNGIQAVADAFGMPVLFGVNGDGIKMQMLDNQGACIGGTGNLSTTASATTYYEEEKDGYTLYRTATGTYLTINSNGNVVSAGNASNATRWKLLTSSQRNAVIAARTANKEKQIARNANIGLSTLSLAQHAESDFTATDMTNRVTNASLAANTNGWTVTGAAPQPESNVMEVYEGNGTTLSQKITGLPKGLYRVSLYAFYRDGWPANCIGFANDGFQNVSNAWLAANDNKVMIADWASQHTGDAYPNFRNEARACFNEGKYRNDVYVFVDDSGELTISFGSPQKLDGGWFCFANASLTYYGMNDEYEPEYSIIEPDVPDNPERTLSIGKYYFINRASGTMLTAGNDFGTRASLQADGLDITLTYKTQGQYLFNTRISNGTDLNFIGAPQTVGGAVYMDAPAFNYAITKNAEGYYLISYKGVSEDGLSKRFYLGYNEANPTVLSSRLTDANDHAAQWEVLTRTQLIQKYKELAVSASEKNPLEVTSLVYGPNFSRNDLRNTANWKGSPTIDGDGNNFCAEKFNTAFDVYQTFTGLPAGNYRVTAQGFYRHGLPEPAFTSFQNNAEDGGAVLYANDASVPLASIFSDARKNGFPANGAGRWSTPGTNYTVPDDMLSASTVFSAGFYVNTLDFRVESDGKLRLGFKKTAGATPDGNWSIFDNIHLYIIGLDDVTEIESIHEDNIAINDNSVYDLSGRRVANDFRSANLPCGIYIVNGKKLLIK